MIAGKTYEIYWVDEYGDVHADYPESGRYIALTPGKAKYQAFQRCQSYYEDITWPEFLKNLKCKCVGKTKLSDYFEDIEQFNRVKEYRGIEFAELGMRVNANGKDGYIVGANGSCNLQILYDGWEYAVNNHPYWEIVYFSNDGSIIKDYRKKSEDNRK